MRKICVFPILFICMISVLFGCVRRIQTSADELTSKDWYTENLSGVSATLIFSQDSAFFTFFDKGEEVAKISGIYAVDSKKLYITSNEYFTTFEFVYKAYNDRVEITYSDNTLVFLPITDAAQK